MAAVLDLPGVVEHVPGDATGGIAGEPTLLDQRLALAGGAEDAQQVGADGVDRGAIAGGGLAGGGARSLRA